MKTFGLLLAAGRSERFGSDKLWVTVQGRPLWTLSLSVLRSTCDAVGIVCQPGRDAEFREHAPDALFVVAGGSDRQESCLKGLDQVPEDFEAVLVHDAARPYVTEETVKRVTDAVRRTGAAFPFIPVTDTVKIGEGVDWTTPERSKVVAVQTPQGAKRDWLVQAHRSAPYRTTDEASLLEAAGYPVEGVPGDLANIKVTYSSDIQNMSTAVETRVGLGYDVHAFSTDPERPMWLGGVEFDDRPGLEGHSDADALLHAIVDALLGAAGLGDIGIRYPNTDPRWKDAPSSLFLRETAEAVRAAGWQIRHIDSTVLAERPKLSPKSEDVRRAIAHAASIDVANVSIKATTNERLGAIGRGEGIAAFAVATLARLG